MISILKNEFNSWEDGVPKGYVEIACTSTDTKPTTGIVTGSTAIEADTGKTFVFDEASAKWTETKSGGGGGNGSSSVLYINITYDEDTDIETFDKTAGEILSAIEAGCVVVGKVTDDSVPGQTITNLYYLYDCSVITIPFEQYGFTFFGSDDSKMYAAASEDDYPETFNENS